MIGTARARVENEPAYVLHTYPFRETSLVAEVFSRAYGRVALVARGARRPRSAVRGMLLAFQPQLLSWFGRSELRTLHKAEWQRPQPQLAGTALLCGFYLNELLLRLTRRDDPHEALFDYYQETLEALRRPEQIAGGADPGRAYAVLMRRFELRLLKELGYAAPLTLDAETGEAVQAGKVYDYVIERGPVLSPMQAGAMRVEGKTLLDMARDDYSDPTIAVQSKQLMRVLIDHYLGGQELHTRQLMRDLQQL